MRRHSIHTAEKIHAGCHFEMAVRFHCWAQSLQSPPEWRQVADRFNVSRATAYRYLAAWRAATATQAA